MLAAIESDFELAGQIVGQLLAEKCIRHLLGIGPDVENFVLRQTGQRAGGHVAHRVEAGFARGETEVSQTVHQIRHAA